MEHTGGGAPEQELRHAGVSSGPQAQQRPGRGGLGRDETVRDLGCLQRVPSADRHGELVDELVEHGLVEFRRESRAADSDQVDRCTRGDGDGLGGRQPPPRSGTSVHTDEQRVEHDLSLAHPAIGVFGPLVPRRESLTEARARSSPPADEDAPPCYSPSSVGTTTTGQRAWWVHCWLTDPRSSPAKPPRPREPTTSRSAPWAASSSADAAPPNTRCG